MTVGLFPQTDEGDTTMAEGPRMTAAQLHVLADANSYRFLV
jgi:hypothetical protein